MSWIFNEEVLAVLAAIIIVSAVFAGTQVFNAGRVIEPFSELGILGPNGKIADYPREIVAGTPFNLYVYVGNHEGKTVFYKVLVKAGDKNSKVNETIPLEAEPLMVLPTVLAHNSSETTPLYITLSKPGTNVRLVFEMWIFNETSNSFVYHGRWNQLWINVTSPPLSEAANKTQTLKSVLTPEMEAMLVDGYLSIRKAESSGGDVSEMVSLLKRALKLGSEGSEARARSLVGQVVFMEPEVSRLGFEASRFRLYMFSGVSAALAVAFAGSYVYLRRRIWVYWAKLHKGWKVVWKGNESKLGNVEKAVRNLSRSGGEKFLENIVFSSKTGYGASEVARAMFKLSRNGAVRLVDPNPPVNFAGYLFSRYGLGFTFSSTLVGLCIFSVYSSALFPSLAAVRIVLGSLFTLFLPGYALIEALYPREEELSPLERLALSIGLSLALVPLVGLALNYTPWGIRLDPIVVALSALTLSLLFVSAYRKFCVLKLKAAAAVGG